MTNAHDTKLVPILLLKTSLTSFLSVFQRLEIFSAYSSPPLIRWGGAFQDQWMPETMDSTEPYICYVFSYIYIHTDGKV